MLFTCRRYRKSRTYRALMSHLSRTYHALKFAGVFVGIIYIVYNTGELMIFYLKDDAKIRKYFDICKKNLHICRFFVSLHLN